MLKQLKKTQANISIWGLLISSQKHRRPFLEGLTRKEVPVETSPMQVLSLLVVDQVAKTVVTFSNEDLPSKGNKHNRALHVTLECKRLKVPVVLIDDGSALNVCPLRTADKLGITKENLTPSSLTVKAYNNTCHRVLGTFVSLCKVGPIETEVEFYVMDISSNYNLLLGRAWLHPLQAVSSTVHQRIKLP